MTSSSSAALTIRTLTDGDIEAVNSILQASYGDTQNRIPRMRRYKYLQPDGWFLALLDDAPAGVIGTIDYGSFAYCGLLGVHPYAQRRGIGTLLLQQVLEWLDARRCPLVLVNVVNTAVPLYRKRGFVIDDSVWVFRAERIVAKASTPPNIRVLGQADLAAVATFDQPLFGANRLAVLEELLVECHGRAFMSFGQNGQISGYLFVQSETIGPWMATNPIDAEALLSMALPFYTNTMPQVIVPAANQAAADILQRNGFRAQPALRHMRRGGTTNPVDRSQVYGQTSLVIG